MHSKNIVARPEQSGHFGLPGTMIPQQPV